MEQEIRTPWTLVVKGSVRSAASNLFYGIEGQIRIDSDSDSRNGLRHAYEMPAEWGRDSASSR